LDKQPEPCVVVADTQQETPSTLKHTTSCLITSSLIRPIVAINHQRLNIVYTITARNTLPSPMVWFSVNGWCGMVCCGHVVLCLACDREVWVLPVAAVYQRAIPTGYGVKA